LRQDRRVVLRERINARYLGRAEIPEPIDIIACDAGFIGLATLLPAPLKLAAAEAVLVALVKPQFEAGREHVGSGGVVRDATVQQAVCVRIAGWVAEQPGWTVLGIAESPIRGADGNREFLLCARRAAAGSRG
jgi:23S rRNA (cytidine1920-2'-O)/16S rRNA (cytidine1409-2'-O)-methyltransferase